MSSPASMLAAGPLYQQVKDAVVRGLAAGEWKPGDMLPPEPDLAERFGVSISTVRAAIGQLVAGKVLSRRQGKGTFVALHGERRSIHQFFHVVRNDGLRELPRSELLSLRRARADDETAELLRLPRSGRGIDVYRMRNVLRVGGTPVVVSDVTIACSRLPGLDEKAIRAGETLYAVYQMRYGLNIVRTVEQLRAGRPDAAAARIFGLAAGDPVLAIRRLAYTFNDEPVEMRRIQVDTRHYFYHSDQHGRAG
jgi:GntR family transcriptional regulator